MPLEHREAGVFYRAEERATRADRGVDVLGYPRLRALVLDFPQAFPNPGPSLVEFFEWYGCQAESGNFVVGTVRVAPLYLPTPLVTRSSCMCPLIALPL